MQRLQGFLPAMANKFIIPILPLSLVEGRQQGAREYQSTSYNDDSSELNLKEQVELARELNLMPTFRYSELNQKSEGRMN